MAVLLLFFASGATALIYEVIWSRYLSLIFGSTVQAQTVVLAGFMGGLALGNRLLCGWADRLRKPLAVYGWIELTIGLYAFFFPQLYNLGDRIFVVLGAKVFEHSEALLVLKTIIGVCLLIVPTILMGGTLPLLAAWLQRRSLDAARTSTIFYSVNSLGAVCGAGIAGFYLVQSWGMVASLQLSALVNLIVGTVAVMLGSREDPNANSASGLDGNATPASTHPESEMRWPYVLVALSGGISMGLEVLASRAVGLMVGGSLQAFAVVLMAFILGIGLGAASVAQKSLSQRMHVAMIGWLLLGASWLVFSFVALIKWWAIGYSYARYAIAPNQAGFVLHQFIVAVVAIGVLGLPAAFIGAVLPLTIRIISAHDQARTLGNRIGRLLTWNTIGGVGGVAITGFCLMPLLGLRGALVAAAAILAGVAILVGHRTKANPTRNVGSITLVIVVATGLMGGQGWQHILGAGLYRIRDSVATAEFIERRQKTVQIKYYKDAADATVAVETATKTNEPPQLLLRINGKADASTYGDLSTQYLLGHLPLLARPESADVFILGLGSGITAAATLTHPIRSLDIAENCRPVIEAAELFAKWNRGALHEPRTKVWMEDARTVLKLRKKNYDVIISEPSNPWVPGIGSVFSQEFYKLCASRLKPGGIMTQWFHIYEMHDGIVDLVLRTFASVFPFVEVWDCDFGDVILVGGIQPWESGTSVYQRSFQIPSVMRDLDEIGLSEPASLLARQVSSQQNTRFIPGDGPIQQDEFPVLEYAAPEAFFIGKTAQQLFRFDERTLQCLLAPPTKRTELMALSNAALRRIFGGFTSSNADLLKYVRWRTRPEPGKPVEAIFPDDPLFPVIFRKPESYPTMGSNRAGAEAVESELPQLEARIMANRPDSLAALSNLQQLVFGQSTNSPSLMNHAQQIRLCVIGARGCLANGDMASASRLVEAGLRLSPEEPELQFFSRMIKERSNSAWLTTGH